MRRSSPGRHRARLLFGTLLLLGLATQSLLGQGSTQRRPLVLLDITVIDATGAPAAPHQTVLIERGVIRAIGAAGMVPLPTGAQLVRSRGRFLIPGLWDMHTHVAWDYLKPVPPDGRTPAAQRANREYFFPLFLANGVLGIRDMAGVIAVTRGWKTEIAAGKLDGPRMIITGQKLGRQPVVPGAPFPVTTEEEARVSVRMLKAEKADFVKIDGLYPRLYPAVFDEAHRLGLTVVGHVTPPVNAAEVVEFGQHSIEHNEGVLLACSSDGPRLQRELGRWRFPTLLSKWFRWAFPSRNPAQVKGPLAGSYDATRCTALAERMRAQDVWLCPTLRSISEEAFAESPDANDSTYRAYLLKAMDILPRKPQGEALEEARAYFRQMVAADRLFHHAGVSFLAGSDTPALLAIPGFSLHDELAMFVDAGFTPMEALQTATINAARFLGIDDSVGTIQPGKIADLVILDGDPIADIHNTRKVNSYVRNGSLVTRDSIDRMLAGVRTIVPRWDSLYTVLRRDPAP